MRVRGVVKSLLRSFSYRPESLSSYSPYTCTWGGNRRGLGREEEGPAPILILISRLFLATVHIRVRGVVIEGVWGRKRRGQPHTSRYPLSGYGIVIVRQIRSHFVKDGGEMYPIASAMT
jgi:hypothetical protein